MAGDVGGGVEVRTVQELWRRYRTVLPSGWVVSLGLSLWGGGHKLIRLWKHVLKYILIKLFWYCATRVVGVLHLASYSPRHSIFATNWLHNVYVHYTMLLRVSAILFWPSSGSCRYNRRVQRIWQFVIDEFQAIYMCVCMCVCVYIYIYVIYFYYIQIRCVLITHFIKLYAINCKQVIKNSRFFMWGWWTIIPIILHYCPKADSWLALCEQSAVFLRVKMGVTYGNHCVFKEL